MNLSGWRVFRENAADSAKQNAGRPNEEIYFDGQTISLKSKLTH